MVNGRKPSHWKPKIYWKTHHPVNYGCFHHYQPTGFKFPLKNFRKTARIVSTVIPVSTFLMPSSSLSTLPSYPVLGKHFRNQIFILGQKREDLHQSLGVSSPLLRETCMDFFYWFSFLTTGNSIATTPLQAWYMAIPAALLRCSMETGRVIPNKNAYSNHCIYSSINSSPWKMGWCSTLTLLRPEKWSSQQLICSSLRTALEKWWLQLEDAFPLWNAPLFRGQSLILGGLRKIGCKTYMDLGYLHKWI